MIYIALLRGINVGGKNIIKMHNLKQLCASIGLQQVQTYIQSGNIIFNSNNSEGELINKLETEIEKTFGFPVAVVIRTLDELQSIVANCPFTDDEIQEAQSTPMVKVNMYQCLAQILPNTKLNSFPL